MLNKILNKLKLSINVRNVAKISSGTMVGQIVSFITLPIFTRIYGVKILGIWATMYSISIIINSFSDLGLTNAIMIEESEEDTLLIYKVVSTIGVILSILSGVVIFIYNNYTNPSSYTEHYIISLMIIIIAFTFQQTQICYTWLNKKGQYNILMKNPIINNVFAGVIAIGMGMMGQITYGYYIGMILGQIVTLIHLKRYSPNEIFLFNIKEFYRIVKLKREFVIYQMPTNIITQVKNQLPILFIRALFGAEMVGYYSISVKILNIPVNLLATAIGRVYYQSIASMKDDVIAISNFTYRNLKRAMNMAIFPIILLYSLSDVLIPMVLGPEYVIAGDMIRIVVFNAFSTFMLLSSRGLAIVLNKQKYPMISTIIQLIVCALSFIAGYYVFDSIYIGLALMSACVFCTQTCFFCALFNTMKFLWWKYLKNILVSLSIIVCTSYLIRLFLLLIGVLSTL